MDNAWPYSPWRTDDPLSVGEGMISRAKEREPHTEAEALVAYTA